MKITCDNCGAKYSIADEKVQGKVFKIRCKKCSNIIVVRGTNDADDIAASDAGGGGDADDGWHVVIGREQTGPMGAAEIRERFAAGEINADSYIWREGFADWQRLAAVPAFSDLGGAPPAAESAPAIAGAAAAGQPDLFAGADADAGGEETNRTDAGSLFGTDAGGGGQDLFAGQGGEPAPEADAGGGGLFTSSPADAPAEGGGGDLFGGVDVPSDPSVPVSDDAHMTGQRGENSVLFSLANLQALAMGGKSTVADAGPAAPTAAAPAAGMASGGGSGLIDIRAMAASTGASTASSHDAELPALGGFASPIAAAPVLLPTASEERPKWVLPAVIGMGSLLVVTVVVLFVVLMGGDDKQPPTKVAQNTTTPKTGAAGEDPATKDKPATATEKAADPTASATGGDTKKGATAAETKPGEASPKKATRSTKRRRSSRRGKRSARTTSPSPTRSATPTAAPKRKKRSGKRDELDDLIDGAITGKKKRRTAPARRASSSGSSSNLPDRLERSQIQAGMRKVKGRVKGCYDRFKVPGLAMVRVTISGSGKVSSARVSGLFAGTPTGSCVASAVKSARFARCKKSTTITYPFSLR